MYLNRKNFSTEKKNTPQQILHQIARTFTENNTSTNFYIYKKRQ